MILEHDRYHSENLDGDRSKNYEQVVQKDKGRLLGTLAKVPKLDSFVKNKVDQTIEKKVKENLEEALP